VHQSQGTAPAHQHQGGEEAEDAGFPARNEAGVEQLVRRRRKVPGLASKYMHVSSGGPADEGQTCCSAPGSLTAGALVMLVRLRGVARRHNGKVGTIAKVHGKREKSYTVALRTTSRADKRGGESLVVKGDNLICHDEGEDGGSVVSTASSAVHRSEAQACGFVLPG